MTTTLIKGEWTALAQKNFDKVLSKGKKFTSDDVWVGLPAPQNPAQGAAMGSIFATAARHGLIVHVGHKRTVRPSAKGRDIKVWKPKARKTKKSKS